LIGWLDDTVLRKEKDMEF